MFQEGVTNKEEVLVLSWQSAFVDDKVAFLMRRLIKVLFWVNFENVVAHLETHGLHLGCNVLAALLHMAECLIRGAIEVWQSLCPLLSDFLENIWRNGKLGRSRIDDSWV